MQSNYDVYDEQDSATTFDGYITNPNSSSSQGTSSSSISSDPNNGIVTAVIQSPTLGSSPLTVQYINGHFLSEGTNVLPSGATVVKDSVNNVAYGTYTDANGTAWRADGAADADGTDIDITITNSLGYSNTDKYPASLWTSGSTLPQAGGRQPVSLRHLESAARVAVVAGGVAATMGMIAAVSAVIPGGQVVAATAGILAAGAGLVAAGAAIVDYNEKQKTGSKC